MSGNPAYSSMFGMMGANMTQGTVPTQTFNSQNILGTPVPQVGDAAARPNYAAGVSKPSSVQVAVVAAVLIGVGYLAYHINFEK